MFVLCSMVGYFFSPRFPWKGKISGSSSPFRFRRPRRLCQGCACMCCLPWFRPPCFSWPWKSWFGPPLLWPCCCRRFLCFISFSPAAFGVFLNLKAPNLTWKNETVPIKQSMSMVVSIFGSWGITAVLCVSLFPPGGDFQPAGYALLVAALLLVLSLLLLRWIKTRGAEIFASL